MKKLILLLLTAAVLAGTAFAQGVAYPFGVMCLDAALYGDSVDSYAVTPYTVPAVVLLQAGQTAGMEADYYNERIGRIIRWAEQYQTGELTEQEFARLVTAQITGMLDHQSLFGGYSLGREVDYPLRQ
jgi:uncharacterized membrane protein